MTAKERITVALSEGESNAVSLFELIRISGLDNRSTRLLIEQLRREGFVICSSERGYYLPADADELRRYVSKERRRADSITETLAPAAALLEEWGG